MTYEECYSVLRGVKMSKEERQALEQLIASVRMYRRSVVELHKTLRNIREDF